MFIFTYFLEALKLNFLSKYVCWRFLLCDVTRISILNRKNIYSLFLPYKVHDMCLIIKIKDLSGIEVIKLFSYSTRLSMKFILLNNTTTGCFNKEKLYFILEF